ncbi:MAG: replication-associated recombination protein A [Pseudomonadota bacterium]|uniref:replication-associated recombination protein A n=1 Tax=Gallaecimonas pentaromativorans TaxID=584787 RepID=UPI00067E729E|nr:replication-associated recombination protein A [Gallaecimonas pentaromativorans]MED5523779.1 replication-associated recombination protein A [Pseudomonadota bacterium]
MSTLGFDFGDGPVEPLAARMRPKKFDDYVGQQHLVGEGKALRRALEAGKPHSMILWGPPGTGKTTLAELIARYSDAEVERISAVTSGIKDIRAVVERAHSRARKTLLFVDEVHRFNKSQQDAFLPHIEDGTFIFIGATTENPSFELNGALLSRARVYVLKSLENDDISDLIKRALVAPEGLQGISLDDEGLDVLTQMAGGDARRALNYLEMLSDMADDGRITKDLIASTLGPEIRRYDKGGDLFYDMISAFHKSVRGSSPDAALYWYCRMLEGGCDPLYVARRLLAIASEDIGNADPKALTIGLNAWDTFTRVGPAEGERAIAQAAVYMACAPKSNAVYTAFKAARRDAKEAGDLPVPVHIRNAPTKLMASLGYGAEYRYAHNEPGAYAAGENFFPPELKDRRYYQPSNRGLEQKIGEKLNYLLDRDRQSPVKRYSDAEGSGTLPED